MSRHPNPGRYENMQYRYCGKSRAAPACAVARPLAPSFGHVQPLDTQRALLRKAFDLGITHFDLANNYGPPAGSAKKRTLVACCGRIAACRDELIIPPKAGYDMAGAVVRRPANIRSPAPTRARSVWVWNMWIFLFPSRGREHADGRDRCRAGPCRCRAVRKRCMSNFVLFNGAHAENG